MLSFKQLEAVYWVSQLGTFAAAAEKLHASESAISKRITELETFFDLPLFDRSQRRARLTRRGVELVAHAELLLRQRDRLLEHMGKEAALVRQFRFGVTELVALTWLPRLVQRFQSRYPQVSFEPEIDLSTNLCDKLEQGSIDMVIVPPVFRRTGMVAVPLKTLQLSWMCSPELITEADDNLSLSGISDYPILTQTGRSGVDSVYDAWFDSQSLKVRKVYAGNSLISLAALTVGGFGVSYLPTLYFRDLAEQGLLRELQLAEPAPEIPYYAVYRNDDSIAGFNANVAQLCVQCCDFAKPAMGAAVYRPAGGALGGTVA